MRGCNVLRKGRKRNSTEEVYHLLDRIARSHKLVCRTVFAGEVLGAVAAADDLLAMALSLHEIQEGPEDNADRK